MARYQNGSVRAERRSDGLTWAYRFRVTRSDGKRVEHKIALGLVSDIGPTEKDAWREVDRQHLREEIKPAKTLSWEAKDLRAALSTLHVARTARGPVGGYRGKGIYDNRNLQADSQQARDPAIWDQVRARSRAAGS